MRAQAPGTGIVLQSPRRRVMMSGFSRHEDGQQNTERHSERLAGMCSRCHHIDAIGFLLWVQHSD